MRLHSAHSRGGICLHSFAGSPPNGGSQELTEEARRSLEGAPVPYLERDQSLHREALHNEVDTSMSSDRSASSPL